ncbi:uncharacterized protein LOC105662823 isoform X3 [Megachile rotundata]|uniref:uncharacterized protein LOC105662823 isoform X3 n=1 Tax=Megachile rotundata TaxID=143995 RepID=UPI003FD5CDB5
MRKTCLDPECPANRQIASTSKPPKSKHKKGRPLCHKNCPTSSKTSIKPRKRSKCARSKKRSKERSTTSKIKYCKNKKCQASKQYVESSTSVHVPEKICVSSKDSVRLCTSKLPCKDPRPGRRTTCNCRPRQTVPEKKRRSKQYSRQRKLLAPLCICVRTSSVDTFRRDTCPILAKYGECCCRRHRRKRSKRNETSMTPRRDLGTKRKCHCRPPTSRNQQNIFLRGLSFFRRKMPKFKRTSNNPKPNPRPRARSYPAENCASRSCLKNRNKRSSERRKVKFYK